MSMVAEKVGTREEAIEMMREGLAIQMYNELSDYSSKQKDVAWKKLNLLEKIDELQEELTAIEKEEKLINHEIHTRRDMLRKLAKESIKRGKTHDISRNIG